MRGSTQFVVARKSCSKNVWIDFVHYKTDISVLEFIYNLYFFYLWILLLITQSLKSWKGFLKIRKQMELDATNGSISLNTDTL